MFFNHKKTKKKFYIDTAIWIDLCLDRKGFNNEPLGTYALKLFSQILANKNILLISSFLIKELNVNFNLEEINGMLRPFEKIIEKFIHTKSQSKEARQIAKEKNIPFGDVLHAIIARDNGAILITRDKHFRQLTDISNHYKPEELI